MSGTRVFVAAALMAPLSGPVFADLLPTTDPTISRNLCVGSECLASETYPSNAAEVKLKDIRTQISFVDESSVSFPRNDWTIRANDDEAISEGGENQLLFIDATSGAEVLMIKAGAAASTMVLDEFNRVGLGTELPLAGLHLVGSSLSKIRMENTTESVDWSIDTTADGLVLRDQAYFGTTPFVLENNAPANTVRFASTGNVGLGTSTPSAPLHILSYDGTADDAQGIVVENANSSTAVRGLLTMRNKGGSYFTLDNTSAGTTWYFVHENASPNRFIISDAVADGPEMSLTADGDLTVPGAFISGSTTLNVPDYVFEPGYDLRPLSEVSAFIDQNGHLPEVPSAADVARDGLDITQMQMAQLKKIEEMTLYMLEQQAVIEAQAKRLAQIEALLLKQ
ncbi:hypothetical protein [Pacificoceanicola onchidii]|uniref:hypothetical protein n=1 Tax=Pacificoceanicola onchidii TaxID=2562685 RepID=UPI0010A5BBB3|nr:hypothetical protein [Pacificoceanicola onchidii]